MSRCRCRSDSFGQANTVTDNYLMFMRKQKQATKELLTCGMRGKQHVLIRAALMQNKVGTKDLV